MSLLPRPGGKVPPSGSKKSSGGSPSNGWVDGGNVADSRRIPPYDATKDKHGGLAPKISVTDDTVDLPKRVHQRRATDQPPQRHVPITCVLLVVTTELTQWDPPPAHRGNITFESDMPGNGGMELEVLKAIILREDYLTRLLDMSKRESQYTLVGSMANTLDLIRLTTVEVVEAIAAWRKLQPKHMPFKWNGVNYLLKVPSDLDFMQEVVVLRSPS
ncbi:hypothetical protein AaE_010022 [Aphanomyces astaci]|uniref:Uncharacterized protein n=1 Tax=Aphanomyces astaci TaxID=112090 RepID=A0A6A5A6J2_APHAT|nr:hypothetical protein AaE_010022 [Aphanomyces astaci]